MSRPAVWRLVVVTSKCCNAQYQTNRDDLFSEGKKEVATALNRKIAGKEILRAELKVTRRRVKRTTCRIYSSFPQTSNHASCTSTTNNDIVIDRIRHRCHNWHKPRQRAQLGRRSQGSRVVAIVVQWTGTLATIVLEVDRSRSLA